ncbi:MAG: hypothetical protein SGPRY_005003 [Prymnesium sp.]
MKQNERNTLYVAFQHVQEYNLELADAIRDEFHYLEPYLRAGVRNVMANLHRQYVDEHKDFYIAIFNMPYLACIRDLKTLKIGKLISFSGTVTRTSEVRPELLQGIFHCEVCGTTSDAVTQQFKYTEPVRCKNPSCPNRTEWKLRTDVSKFVDWQRIRVQENANEIPAGSMPRTLDVILRGASRLAEWDGRRTRNTRVVLSRLAQLGRSEFWFYSALPSLAPQLAAPGERPEIVTKVDPKNATEGVQGLKALGVRELTYRLSFLASSVQASPAESRLGVVNIRSDGDDNVMDSFSQAEKEQILRMKRTANVYDKLAASIAPSVYGHEEVKRGILLMLFGGVHKKSPKDGTNLRGDINCCLVGDPSTAKSQFLKFVCSIVPRSVYASGKVHLYTLDPIYQSCWEQLERTPNCYAPIGATQIQPMHGTRCNANACLQASSAAGLTATVSRDEETGELCIEAGALMLSDNGICCIDEFDTMESKDQVAIHEAMEQQTISIAKAGIHATLNARASILAAANPEGGRYDRKKNLRQNLNLTSAIMSRFDLFFVVESHAMEERTDFAIARHIVALHQTGKAPQYGDSEYTTSDLQRYIKYARSLSPKLSDAAARKLVAYYRDLRQQDYSDSSTGSYRVTVRQLEAMVRLGEARARVDLSETIEERHIKEARRLLKESIMHVSHDDVDVINQDEFDAEIAHQAEAAEAQLNQERKHQELSGAKKAETCTYQKFKKVERSLVVYIRSHEGETGAGLAQQDVIEWYLNQQEELDDLEALAAERKLVRRIIQRLIKTDKVTPVQAYLP